MHVADVAGAYIFLVILPFPAERELEYAQVVKFYLVSQPERYFLESSKILF